MKTVYFVVGPPSAGKSTVARELSREFDSGHLDITEELGVASPTSKAPCAPRVAARHIWQRVVNSVRWRVFVEGFPWNDECMEAFKELCGSHKSGVVDGDMVRVRFHVLCLLPTSAEMVRFSLGKRLALSLSPRPFPLHLQGQMSKSTTSLDAVERELASRDTRRRPRG